jgi:hypothetical protein
MDWVIGLVLFVVNYERGKRSAQPELRHSNTRTVFATTMRS